MPAQNWRVGHQGRDMMFYEECRDGVWTRIEIQGEMLMGRAHHVIYFASPEAWQRYPEWARDRRDEIIARIKSAFREPDYEYSGGGSVTTTAPAPRTAAPPNGRSAMLAATTLAFAISGGMAWLVLHGLATDETYWPAKLPSQGRTVSRATEPAMYSASIATYAAVGAGALCLGLWGVRETGRIRP